MRLLDSLFDIFSSFVVCCIPNPNISINGRAYRIIKLLGEGGFSFVYLAQDGSGNLYALKKIRCTLGTEEAELAQREVDAYQMFSHKNIIKMLDSSTITEHDGSKTIYIFLPYYRRGNLQDAINKNNMNNTHFEEIEMFRLFREICVGVRVMHTFRGQSAARIQYEPTHAMTHEEESRQDQALLGGSHQEQSTGGIAAEGKGEVVPWAHRDIKPGNVLIADDGQTAVLMDFGSACQARIHIENRQEALAQQDLAAEHCTMPYRAPELFDVKTGTTLDEKVDIWSLGCTLYAMAYGQSPFEMNTDQGGSVALAVLNNQYKFPENNVYSQNVKDLIQWMLTTDPSSRPDIHQVLSKLDEVLNTQQ
ncbi:kinase-like protein [Rhizopus microsporus var. microsporus]|uniref:non-specific serine/threonine protein kinase n=2 Tax=Rhizopus microsporus TaxID=58291 RepID=A0A2G4SLN9_RHIZD|nr:kinase-like protein [Rhizopus microsporus ATCC 52813]ORE02907.1 kinase-like protein [Rhizopus microsporus var. microsporus]PHZ09681.1 kinase-like protein [Rhizopus microsporus ATCC 52813]